MSNGGDLRYHMRMREARESELQSLRGSWTWRFLNRLRNARYRIDSLFIRSRSRASAPQSAAAPRNPAPAEPGSVVCLPLIEWDFRFQRPQQLMMQFAGHGHRVFYASATADTTTEKAPGVLEVPLREVPCAELVIVQHPKWRTVARELGGRIVYDCMDLLSGFSTEARNDDERRLLAEADLVVVTSAALEREARKYAKRIAVVRNGCDYDHFAQTPPAGGPRKVIGYYGAISDWFDVGLVAELAARRPDWDFLLVGATWGADLLPLAGRPNVVLPGEKPYPELPEWLAVMDVCIIPFRRTPLTEATNPVKVYEMLAAGRAVVSVPIPEVAALAPLVRLASTAGEFEVEIEEALRERDGAEARRAFAREQTWEKRFEELSRALG